MFLDARTLSAAEFKDRVCIIGGGIAGIVIALELESQGIPVTVLESGGFEEEPRVQKLAQGELTGRPYYPLESSRLRYFGGCSHHWAGLCRPLDALDFEARDYLAEDGWPLSRATLEPYYRDAREYLALESFPESDPSRLARVFPADGNFELDYEQFSREPYTAVRYREHITRSRLIKVYLHAHVVALEADADDTRLDSLTVRTLPATSERRLRFSADRFVLATGGIENARMLMLTGRDRRRAFGDRHANLGRYFMEHLHVLCGQLAVASPTFPFDLFPRVGYLHPYLRLRDRVQRERGILNCRMVLETHTGRGEVNLAPAVRAVAARMDGAATEPGHPPLGVSFISEQEPNRASYVTLGESKDVFGNRRPALHWRLSDLDRKTIDANLWELARAVGRAGHGRLRFLAGQHSEWGYDFVTGGHHHMGTTRMHPDPRKGVVDPECRLFDLPNLYVAGSSVFPMVGHANPTYTLTAIAIRLARHLGRGLTPPALTPNSNHAENEQR